MARKAISASGPCARGEGHLLPPGSAPDSTTDREGNARHAISTSWHNAPCACSTSTSSCTAAPARQLTRPQQAAAPSCAPPSTQAMPAGSSTLSLRARHWQRTRACTRGWVGVGWGRKGWGAGGFMHAQCHQPRSKCHTHTPTQHAPLSTVHGWASMWHTWHVMQCTLSTAAALLQRTSAGHKALICHLHTLSTCAAPCNTTASSLACPVEQCCSPTCTSHTQHARSVGGTHGRCRHGRSICTTYTSSTA